MDFTIKNIQGSASSISRRIGYVIIDFNGLEKYNMVRKLTGLNYPRFHVYLTQRGTDFLFSLHLDQKKPVYQGSAGHAHNGEYFGPVVEGEADRIKSMISGI